MAFPTDGYTATALYATIRATDGVDEQILTFTMDKLTNDHTQAAALAACAAAKDVFLAAYPDWDVIETIRYTGIADVTVD